MSLRCGCARRIGVLVALLFWTAGQVRASVRVYDVEPRLCIRSRAVRGGSVSEVITARCDSLTWVDFFAPALPRDSGLGYQADITARGQVLYSGRARCRKPGFVRIGLARTVSDPSLAEAVGFSLRISDPQSDSITFCYSRNNGFPGSYLVEPESCVPRLPHPCYGDLVARVEGVVRNDELVTLWDDIPNPLFSPPSGRSRADESLALAAATEKMEELGVTANRISVPWPHIQDDYSEPDSFHWDCGMDYCMRMHALHHIRPLVVFLGGGVWPLAEQSNYWPTNLYEPLSDGIRLNRRNHLAWFLYNFALRYGPGGRFWRENPQLPYEPFLSVECNNEPTYESSKQWWLNPTRLLDSCVRNVWRAYGAKKAFAAVYSRYCAVTDSALKLASDSLQAEMYCPYYGEDSGWNPDDWLPLMYEFGGGKVCQQVSLHSHTGPAEFEEERFDTLHALLRSYGMGSMTITVGEGGIPSYSPPFHHADTLLTEAKRGRNLTEIFAACWARNARISNRVARFSWQALSSWYVADNIERSNERWGLTDDLFRNRAAAWALGQVMQMLGKCQFNGRRDGCHVSDPRIRVFEFESLDPLRPRRTWLLWLPDNAPGEAGVVRLPVRTNVVDTFGLALEAAPANRSFALPVGPDGYFAITVGKSPVYVREPADSGLCRPDLVLDSIWTIPSDPLPQKQLTIGVRIRNAGNVATPPCSGHPPMLIFCVNDKQSACVPQLAPLAPSESLLVAVKSGIMLGDTGHFTVRAAVNESGAFTELDEDNNSASICFERTTDNPLSTPLALFSVIPNPVRSRTALTFSLPAAGRVRMRVFDVTGRPVKVLASGEVIPAGLHSLTWICDDDAGFRVPNGVYIVRLETESGMRATKTLVAR